MDECIMQQDVENHKAIQKLSHLQLFDGKTWCQIFSNNLSFSHTKKEFGEQGDGWGCIQPNY